jgi:hypothetical protein
LGNTVSRFFFCSLFSANIICKPIPPYSFGLSATSQQYFSLRTNQHQPSATSQTSRLFICGQESFFFGAFAVEGDIQIQVKDLWVASTTQLWNGSDAHALPARSTYVALWYLFVRGLRYVRQVSLYRRYTSFLSFRCSTVVFPRSFRLPPLTITCGS